MQNGQVSITGISINIDPVFEKLGGSAEYMNKLRQTMIKNKTKEKA